MRITFPAPAINLHDESDWELALRQLRSHLSGDWQIFGYWWPFKDFTSYEIGFPEWFMTSITFTLSKTNDLPVASQTRPITVLAQVYRLWSQCANSYCPISPCILMSRDFFVPGGQWMKHSCNSGGLSWMTHTQGNAASGFCLDLTSVSVFTLLRGKPVLLYLKNCRFQCPSCNNGFSQSVI